MNLTIICRSLFIKKELIKASQDTRTNQREIPESLLSKIKVKSLPAKRNMNNYSIENNTYGLHYEPSKHFIPKAPLGGAAADLKKGRGWLTEEEEAEVARESMKAAAIAADSELQSEIDGANELIAHLSFKEKIVDFLV